MEKNFELLREFNEESAKAGAELCNEFGEEMGHLETGPDGYGKVCFSFKKALYLCHKDTLRMKPLAWASEGTSLRPVYAGDKLYRSCGDIFEVVVERVSFYAGHVAGDFNGYYLHYAASHHGNSRIEVDGSVSDLSWNVPKTKKEGWLNIYPSSTAVLHTTKQGADSGAEAGRVACVKVEWEE